MPSWWCGEAYSAILAGQRVLSGLAHLLVVRGSQVLLDVGPIAWWHLVCLLHQLGHVLRTQQSSLTSTQHCGQPACRGLRV